MDANPSPNNRRTILAAIASLGSILTAGCTGLFDEEADGESPVPYEVEHVLEGLAEPWGIAIVPETSSLLLTERGGTLNRVDLGEGTMTNIEDPPTVAAVGQGGLLDVTLHPEYPDPAWVYLTYSDENDDGETATHLGRGKLEPNANQLRDFAVVHVVEPFIDSGGHFGSRVVFGPDGTLYLTSGDRQFKDFGPDHVSQDTTNELGATIRLREDGSIPADNPFVDDPDVLDSIFTFGHRNVQGITVHPETDELWISEHGEKDGDALHILEAGGNYGWPIAHYGCHYGTDDPVGDPPHERDDVVTPVYFWECESGGFPPAGMAFYDGGEFSDWEGDLFVSNLAGQYLGHFTVDGKDVEEREPLLENRGWRIRDVAVDPVSGEVYVAVDADAAPLIRITPR